MAAWAVGTIAVVVAFRHLHWRGVWVDIQGVKPEWLVAAVILYGLVLPIWALLWYVIRPTGCRVSVRRLAQITAVVSMAANTLPYVGEPSAVALLAGRAELGSPAALSIISIDELLNGMAKLLLLLVVALLVPLPPWMRESIIALSCAVGLASLALIWIAHSRGQASAPPADPRQDALPPSASRTQRLWRKLRKRFDEWARHLEALRSAPKFFGGLALEVCKKTAEIGAIISVQRAFGWHLPVGDALFVLAALNLTTMVPVSPANLGVYEATVFFAYRYLGLRESAALAMGMVQHLCYLLPLAGTGYVVLSIDQLVGRRRGRRHTDASQ